MNNQDRLTPSDLAILGELQVTAKSFLDETFLYKEDPREAETVFLNTQLKRLDLSYEVKFALLHTSDIHGAHRGYWWAFSNLKKDDLILYLGELVVEPKHFPYIVEHERFPMEGLKRIFYKYGYTSDENQAALFQELLNAGFFTDARLLKLAGFIEETTLDQDYVASLLRNRFGISEDIPSNWVLRLGRDVITTPSKGRT